MKNLLRKLFWCLYFLLTGGGVAYYILHLIRPAQDASTPPAWGRAAKETFLPADTPVHIPPGVLTETHHSTNRPSAGSN